MVWDNRKATSKDRETFMEENFSLIAASFNELNNPSCNYTINVGEGLALTEDLYKEFEKFHDNCGSLHKVKYPVLRLEIAHVKENKTYRNEFDFFKFDEGFKLISVDLKNP